MKSLIDREVGEDDNEITGSGYTITVRNLFIVAAVFMTITLPLFNNKVGVPVIGAIAGIIILVVNAGLTSTRHKWSVITDMIISGSALAIFEYFAVQIYNTQGIFRMVLFINQILALIFLYAFLYSIQTLRKWGRG